MDWVYVNPFTGYVYFKNLKIYEQKSDSLFFSAASVGVNISMYKLFNKTYDITSFAIDHPRAIVIQYKKLFNFTDLIDKFSPEKVQDSLNLPVHFSIHNVSITNGEFQYMEREIPVNYSIVKVDIQSMGTSWDNDSIYVKFSFRPQAGSGDLKGDLMFNKLNSHYRLALVTRKLDMGIFEQYLNDFADHASFTANLDADVIAKGNLKDSTDLYLTGNTSLNDFHFGKKPGDDYFSFDKLSVGMNELAPKSQKFFFDTVQLIHPYLKYEMYDYLDNIQRMFGEGGSNVINASADQEKFNLIIEMARYIKVLFKNFLRSDYTINSLSVEKGEIKFNDYSINEKFAAELNPITIKADSVDNKKSRVKVAFESKIKPFGTIGASVSMDPADNRDFDFYYKLQNFPAAAFNPYLITYSSYPLDRGIIEMKGTWNVRNDIIQSTNHFIVIDPRVTKKVKKKDSHALPLPLIMSFIREKGNVIDYEIPITGNMKNPKFHLHDVIWDLIGNIFIKPATTPYRMDVKNIENEIEKLLSLNWKMRQTKLSDGQEDFVDKISNFLKDNKDAKINVHPNTYSEKEKEYILLFEAKKKYFFAQKNQKASLMTEDDSLDIEKMSSKDSLFVKFVDKSVRDSTLFTLQEKCSRFVGKDLITKIFAELIKERKKVFMDYFLKNKTENQVNFFANENTVPFNGFSHFAISYPGDTPKELLTAYQKLNEVNSEAPREKYLKFRKDKEKLRSDKLAR